MKAEIEGDGKKGTAVIKNGRIYVGTEYNGEEAEWALEVQED